MCTGQEVGNEGAPSNGTRSKKLHKKLDTGPHLAGVELLHDALNGRMLASGLGREHGEGQCQMGGYKHASGVCKTCSFGLDTNDPQIFWIYYPGMHCRS